MKYRFWTVRQKFINDLSFFSLYGKITRLSYRPQELAERVANVDAAPRAREARVPLPEFWPWCKTVKA